MWVVQQAGLKPPLLHLVFSRFKERLRWTQAEVSVYIWILLWARPKHSPTVHLHLTKPDCIHKHLCLSEAKNSFWGFFPITSKSRRFKKGCIFSIKDKKEWAWMEDGRGGGAWGNKPKSVPAMRDAAAVLRSHTLARLWPGTLDINLFTFADRLSPSVHDAIDHDLFMAWRFPSKEVD